MRLYLDSANVNDWDSLMPYGVFYGITTNPTLADRAGWKYSNADWQKLIKHARDLGAKELHIQVFGPTEKHVKQMADCKKLGDEMGIEIVAKVPLVPDAIRNVKDIRALDMKVLMTACYSAKQALIATNLGTQYLAPYLGRMKNLGLDVDKQVRQMLAICNAGNCELLAASLRSVDQIVDLAAMGVPTATISADLANQLFSDDNSLKAVADFDAAAV